MPLRVALSVALVAPLLVANGEPVPRITTDSQEYCSELAGRLARLPGAAGEPARRLGEDGIRLCDQGQPRAGVAKLRRAIRAAQAPE